MSTVTHRNFISEKDEHKDDIPMLKVQFQEKLDKLNHTFHSKKTLDLNWRKQQVHRLLEGISAYSNEINQALLKDIGRPIAEGTITQTLIYPIMEHSLKNLEEWAKPGKVYTLKTTLISFHFILFHLIYIYI